MRSVTISARVISTTADDRTADADRIDDAQVAARNAYRRLRHEGTNTNAAAFGTSQCAARPLDVAARVVGFDDAIRASIGENASVDAPLLVGRLDPLLAAGLPTGERVRLAAEGAVLQKAEAFRLAFGATA
jgi:hypothetical protein